jgi:thymidylate synthase (FAD)
MGKVIIDEATPKNPITLAGKMVGPCYGSDTSDDGKNYKRGKNCILDNHGRVFEYMTVWFTLDGYSAKTMREFYTHIGGAPTRTQASTRYISYKGFDYVIPPSIQRNDKAFKKYIDCMENIAQTTKELQEECGIKAEDANMVLPLGMTTVVSCHFNIRTLIEMSHQRLCNRAYWEFRELMKDIMDALSNYSEEWKYLVDTFFKPKCDVYGYCTEKFGCGKYPKREE